MNRKNDFRLKPCPFCGAELEWCDETYTNKNGKKVRMKYFMHPEVEPDCILNLIVMPFTMGAGDAREDEGYFGEYAEAWNRRTKGVDKNEQKE